jgi:hypothetical protein
MRTARLQKSDQALRPKEGLVQVADFAKQSDFDDRHPHNI